MIKIQVANKISDKGLNLFNENYNVGSDISIPDGILVRSAKLHEIEIKENLLAIARAGAGVNNIPINKCSEHGVVVFNTPGANANAVKELVFAALYLSSREIYKGIEWAKTLVDEGENVAKLIEGGKSKFAGEEIYAKTIGVIGLGAIGVMVANHAQAIGMEVIGYDPFISVDQAWNLSSFVQKAKNLEELLLKSDYISIHVPLLDSTKNYCSYNEFSNMKTGVKLLNFSRGGLVDNIALLDAIEKGIVSKYVTDFPDATLLSNDSIIPIPHLGASTKESEENCAIMAVKELKEYIENGNIKNSVNFPNCQLQRGKGNRISVIHKNVPNMIGQITAILASLNYNIEELINKSKGEYAYTVIDIVGDISEEAVSEIMKLNEVIKIRIIK